MSILSTPKQNFFVETDKLILKFICKILIETTSVGKILEKKGTITLLNLKTCNEVPVLKTVCFWHRHRYKSMGVDEGSRNRPTIYGQLIIHRHANVSVLNKITKSN